MDAIKNFFNSPIETYKGWLDPDAGTSERLYTVGAAIGTASLVVAATAYFLTLFSVSFVGLSTSLMLKKIYSIGAVIAVGFLAQAFLAGQAWNGNSFWIAAYRGTIIAATVVPVALLILNGMSHFSSKPRFYIG